MFFVLKFTYKMTYGINRMVEHHPGAGPTHNSTHQLPAVGAVAVYRALPTSRFVDAKRAVAQTLAGIV